MGKQGKFKCESVSRRNCKGYCEHVVPGVAVPGVGCSGGRGSCHILQKPLHIILRNSSPVILASGISKQNTD